jgi:hypothetical protein
MECAMALPPLEIPSASQLLQRLRRLPVWPVEWELDFAREGRWVTPPGDRPYRPLRCLCAPRGLHIDAFGGACAPGEPRLRAVGEAFLRLQSSFEKNAHLPEILFVRDASLAAELEPSLMPLGIAVLVVDELPKIEPMIADMLAGTHGGAASRRSFGPDVSIDERQLELPPDDN